MSLSQGRLSARNFSNFIAANMLTMVVLVCVLQIVDGSAHFQWIILTGACVGLVSSIFIMRTPETVALKKSAAQPIFKASWQVLKERSMRRVVIAHIGGFVLLTAIPPVNIAALKKGYQIEDDRALFFVLIQLCASLLATWVSRIVSERSGPKPLMLLGGLILTGTAALWTMAPSSFNVWFVLVLFGMTGFGALMLIVSLTHCFIIQTPAGMRLPGGMMMNLGGGIGAAIGGFVVAGGGIFYLQESFHFVDLSLYNMYFRLIIPVALLSIWMLSQVDTVTDWRLHEVMSVFFSPRDMRALFTISRMEDYTTPQQDCKDLTSLGNSGSSLSEKSILGFFDSPDFYVRANAINALRALKRTSEATDEALLQELRDNPHTTAYMAAEMLGERGVKKAVPDLLTALKSEDVYLCGKSMIALARLNVQEARVRIEEILKTTENPRLLTHGATASVFFNSSSLIPLLLKRSVESWLPRTTRNELLYAIGRLADCGDTVYTFVRKYHQSAGKAWLIIDELMDEVPSNMQTGSFGTTALLAYCSEKVEDPLLNVIKQGINQTKESSELPELHRGVLWAILFSHIKKSQTAAD